MEIDIKIINFNTDKYININIINCINFYKL